jgi:type II secretory pathway component PulM
MTRSQRDTLNDTNDAFDEVDRLTEILPSEKSAENAISNTRDALLSLEQDEERVVQLPQKRQLWKLVLGGGAVATLAALAYLAFVAPTVIAFAEVQQQIKRARNVTYEFVSGDANKRVTIRYVISGNRRRADWPGNTMIRVPDEKTSLWLKHVEQQAVWSRDNSGQPPAGSDVYEWLTKLAESSVKELGRHTIDGKVVMGFEVPEAGGKRDPMTVWVDPQTRLPIKIIATGNRVMHNFVFDAKVPKGTFDRKVPEGYFVENRYKELQPAIEIDPAILKMYTALVTDSERTARQTIEAFLVLAKGGKTKLVQQLLVEPSEDDLRELDGFESLELAKIWNAKSAALGITTISIASRGENHAFVFTVELVDGTWLIEDIDMESRETILEETKRFREDYPAAVQMNLRK